MISALKERPLPVVPNAHADRARPDRGVVAVLLAGTFMAVLDFFVVNLAIPTMQRELGASPSQIQFIVAGYALAYGSALIVGSRLGDIHGRRRIYALGLALFTLASAACGLAPSAGLVVAARIAQGLAAALLSPQVLSILGSIYEGDAKARALNAYGVVMGLASVFGQVIGGLLMHVDAFGWGWRACFLINVPVGLLALACVSRVVPESRTPRRPGLDLAGMMLVSLALLATIFPLIEGRELGWPSWSWLCFGLAALLFVAFAWYEIRMRARGGLPLLDFGLFTDRVFSVGLLAQLTFYMSMAGFYLVLALYLQEGRGLSALGAALIFCVNGLGYMASANIARHVTARIGRQTIALAGALRAVGLGMLLWTVVTITDGGSALWLLPGLLVNGVGTGFAVAPLTTNVLAQMSPQHTGAASGALTTGLQVGNAIGVAVVGVIFFESLSHDASASYAHAFAWSLTYLIGLSLALAALVQWLPGSRQNDEIGLCRRWRANLADRRALAHLDQRTCHDVGISPAMVDYELRQPFWQPVRNLRD